MPDSDLTASFDGELRKTSLEDLLRRLLVARAAAGSVAVVVEDAHWLDPLSRDLLEALARATEWRRRAAGAHLPPRRDGPRGVARRPGRPRHRPGPGGPRTRRRPRRWSAQRHLALTGREPAAELVTTVVGRAEGNAFYLEQLVDYVLAHASADDGVDPDALELPPSLHSLVLSRIDAQPENQRRAVKVASVIGRAFRSPLVAAAYPDLGPEKVVHDDLVSLTPTRLIELEDPRDKAFAFGHAVTRDVAYDSLPFAMRSLLHGQVGDALEREPDGPDRHLDLLAYHYSRSEDVPKKRRYLRAAADAARSAYANEAAISYLEQLLPLVDDDERSGVLLQLGESLEVRGDWAAAEEAVSRAREAAEAVADAAGDRPRPHGDGRAGPQAGTVRRGRERAGRRGGRLRRRGRRGRTSARPPPARHARLPAGAPRPGPGGVRSQPGRARGPRRRGRRRGVADEPGAGGRGRRRPRRGRAARPGGPGAPPGAGRPSRRERVADQHGHARDRPR